MLAEAMISAARGAQDALRRRKDLEEVAVAMVARAKEAHPKLRIDAEAFVAHVARHVDDAEDVAAALDEIHAADLWLAFACGRGSKAAIAELDQRLGPIVEAALVRMRGKVSPDDVAQLLREKLLVAKSGGAPKILDYSGRGPLGGWMRVAAIRTALSMTRVGDAAAMEPVTREVLLAAPAVSEDPELSHMRKRYAKAFKEAFETALADLDVEDRNVLRLSLVDGLSIDEIGVVFGIHRATAARKLANAKEEIQKRTRKILAARLDVGATELKSIMGYIRSHLDLSIQRLLGREGATPLVERPAPPLSKKVEAKKKRSARATPARSARSRSR